MYDEIVSFSVADTLNALVVTLLPAASLNVMFAEPTLAVVTVNGTAAVVNVAPATPTVPA